jgi:hypothetical protein
MGLPITIGPFFSLPWLHLHRLTLSTSPSAAGHVSLPRLLADLVILRHGILFACMLAMVAFTAGIVAADPCTTRMGRMDVTATGAPGARRWRWRGAEPAPGEGAPRLERPITADTVDRGASL